MRGRVNKKQHRHLHPFTEQELTQWQSPVATASLMTNRIPEMKKLILEFI
jgi:hypothetical protein